MLESTLENNAVLSQVLAKLNAIEEAQGRHWEGEHITYAALYQEWMSIKSVTLSEKTQIKYNGFYKTHLKETLGNLMLTDITVTILTDMVKESGKNLSTSTINDIYRCVVSSSLKYAEGRGLIEKNPMQFVKLPSVEKENGRAMTNEEISAMWTVAKRDRVGSIALPLLLGTGMRKGELLGLEWSDIDLEEGTITINKSWTNVGGKGTLCPPKTKSSYRIITLPAELIALLRAYRNSKDGQGRTYVIGQTRADKRVSPNNFDRSFHKWRDRAGVSKDIHPHCTRHTYCSVMSERGVEAVDLKLLTGHTDTRMLDRVYIHARSNEKKVKAVAKFEGFLMETMGA